MNLLAKSLSDIQPGPRAPEHGANAFDYSHILEPHHQAALPGARIIIKWAPGAYGAGSSEDPSGWLTGELRDGGNKKLGSITADLYSKDSDGRKFLGISTSQVRGAPREVGGRRMYWGRKLYEAMMAHAKNTLGATHIGGGAHSTYASRAHLWLSDRHNMLYDPTPNLKDNREIADPVAAEMGFGNYYHDEEDWGTQGDAPQSNDDRFAPYAYTLKSEFFSKAEGLTSIPVGQLKEADLNHRSIYPPVHYNYDHALTPDQRDKGYHLDIIEHFNPNRKSKLTKGVGLILAHVRKNGMAPRDHASMIEGNLYDGKLDISFARTQADHRNQKLGHSAYEALFAHVKNHHGATAVTGGEHSTAAHTAHLAIANKHGLEWIKSPTERRPMWSPEHGPGSFDGAYGSYALKLHELVSSGSPEIPLAKEEDDTDPIITRLKAERDNGGYYPDVANIELILREQGVQKKHLAAAIRIFSHRNSYDLKQAFATHPLMDHDVFTEGTQEAETNAEINNHRRGLLQALVTENAHLAQSNPDWVLEQLHRQMKHDDTLEPHHKWPGAKAVVLKAMMQLGANHISRLSDEQIASIDLTSAEEVGYTKRSFIDKLKTHYNGTYPDVIKKSLLNYAKNLLGRVEKVKNPNRSPGEDIITEAQRQFPLFQEVAASGIPEEFATSRMSKNLFHSLLATAPNYPKKKVQALLAHFTTPDTSNKRVTGAVRGMMAKLWCNSPHINDDQWTALVTEFGSHFPTDTLVSNPRFTTELAKSIFSRHKDLTLLGHMKGHGKLTPEFVEFAGKAMMRDPAEKIAQSVAERGMATVVASREAAGPYSGHYYMDERGALLSYGGSPHPSYSANPYDTGSNFTDLIKTVGGTNLSDELFDHYFARHQQFINYRPPELVGNRSFESQYPPTAIVGIDNYWKNSHFGVPFDGWHRAIRESGGTVSPHIEQALAPHALDYRVNPDVTSAFMKTVKDESAILHILTNSNHAQHISRLLARSDAQESWVRAVQARPEYHTPASEGDPRFADRTSYHNGYRQLAPDFTKGIRSAVATSPALPPAELSQMLVSAKGAEEVAALLRSPAVRPEHISLLARMNPTRFGDFKRDVNGNRLIVDGDYVREVTEQGDTKWDLGTHRTLLRQAVSAQAANMGDEQWEELQNRGYLTPSADQVNHHMIKAALNSGSTVPSHILNKIYDQSHVDTYNTDEYREDILAHHKCDPGLIQRIVEHPYTSPKEMKSAYLPLLGRSQLQPELVKRMIERARTFAPEVPTYDPNTGRFDRPNDPNGSLANFYERLADSPHAPLEWLKEVHGNLQAAQDALRSAHPNDGFDHLDLPIAHTIKTALGKIDPDIRYNKFPKVLAKVGSHIWRKLRDIIESAGGQLHIGEIQKDPILAKLPGIDKARIMRDMTPEELARIPEKNRPKVPVKKKTDFVSSEGVQKIIDAMPTAPALNLSTTKWQSPLQSHAFNQGEIDTVLQFNHTTDQMNKIREAGLMPIYQTVREILENDFSAHPLTSEGIGWIRHNGVTPSNTLHVTETQSDLRPLGGSWAASLAGSKQRVVPDPERPGHTKTLPAWSGQVIDKFVRNHRWGNNFPAAELDKINDILWGKGVDPDVTMLEALHEHLRSQGHHGVTIHYSGLGMAGALRHGSSHRGVPEAVRPTLRGQLPKDNPHGIAPEAGHFVEAYEDIPAKLGYDMNAAKYGDEPTQKNPNYRGWSYHTSPVRKMEDLMKGIETLPSLPFSHASGGDRVYDASHYLTPDHKKLGYTLQIRTGEGPYGPFSIADVRHGQHIVGGATMYVSDTSMKGKEQRKYGQLDMVGLKDQHIGKKLGLPMYEALMASAKKHWGCTHIKGLQHSSMAHSVHQQLATKHGLEYDSQPNYPSAKYPNKEAWEGAPKTAMDGKWGPYSYPV